jgi:hypothetical protein
MKKTSQKTRVKAKNQQLVSRAVKEAGFKNIKEAKETLAAEKKQILENKEINAPQFIIPEGENYKFILQEIASLQQEGADLNYIKERVNYLVWKTRKAEVEKMRSETECTCAGCGNTQPPASREITSYDFPVNTGYVFSNHTGLQEKFAKELQALFGPTFQVIGVQLR